LLSDVNIRIEVTTKRAEIRNFVFFRKNSYQSIPNEVETVFISLIHP
jgi:hypothetical protein